MKLVILISGNGTNLQAIINAIANHKLDAEIIEVISDDADAYGLQRAQKANINTSVIQPKDFINKEEYAEDLFTHIKKIEPEIIVLAGFMRILNPRMVNHYCGRIVNIHPSLLPKYPGLSTYEKALAAGETEHGTTIHFVTNRLDTGPVIAQATLKIEKGDTPEILKQRVQALEHKLYPEVLQWFISRGLCLKDDEVHTNTSPLPLVGES